MEDTRAEVRICVVGDELVAGVGDARSLGWTGRVGARTDLPGGRLTVFSLGVPGEGTAGLLQRWDAETARRFSPDADNRLVVGLGTADLGLGTSLARSRLALADVLDEAASRSVRCSSSGPRRPPNPLRQNASGSCPPPSPTCATDGRCRTSTATARSPPTTSGTATSPTTACPASRATASWPGSCCTAAGTPGSGLPQR